MSNTNTSGGISFFGALTIVFIALKLMDKVDWSWWWVLSPLWICWVIVLAIFAIIGIVWIISKMLQ